MTTNDRKSDSGDRSPLSDLVRSFEDHIRSQGYSRAIIRKYQRSAQALCDALRDLELSPIAFRDDVAVRLIDQVSASASSKDRKHARYRLERFRDFLIDRAGAPARTIPPMDMSPRACLRREYQGHLKEQRGLADGSIYQCMCFYDRFLTYKFDGGLGDLNAIVPDDITSFMLFLREARNAPRDKTVPTHLRNFFKFLFWSGRTKRDLSKAVPRPRHARPTGIPRYLAPEQVDRLIEAARDHKQNGRRNHAMLLLIARLGLRAPEVVAIDLDDIDWRAGDMLIRGKGQLHDRMPMPKDVGEALVDYIRNERKGPERALFVSVKPPYRRFKDGQILRWILRDAYDATGISPPQSYVGSHILRHSLATDMLRKGASLQEIGDVLRHRSPVTTTIYAQHDVDALRGLARSWPIPGGAA